MGSEGVCALTTISCVEGNRFWCVKSQGDWDRDVDQGKAIASEVAAYLRNDGSPMMLRKIMRDMEASGELDGIGVGFITALAMMVSSGSGDEQPHHLLAQRDE